MFSLKIMALRRATSYGPQVAQVNEKPSPKSYLDMTLTQHLHDEDPEPQEVHVRLEANPPRTWYYRISLNFHTLMVLLQIDLASGDEPETFYEGCYKTEDTSIFAWSSILGIGHYHWLRGLIHELHSNSKANYLVHTIRRILDFL
jgi:hypothetical protein